ncbi:MAG: hypothetical protein LQ351_006497, partial [Letrouitia transgressa]
SAEICLAFNNTANTASMAEETVLKIDFMMSRRDSRTLLRAGDIEGIVDKLEAVWLLARLVVSGDKRTLKVRESG